MHMRAVAAIHAAHKLTSTRTAVVTFVEGDDASADGRGRPIRNVLAPPSRVDSPLDSTHATPADKHVEGTCMSASVLE
jgi:hypothetical protein